MTAPAAKRNWDPLIKLTHWSIVLAILANALFTEEGSAAHIWVGYALAAILALRLLWGLVGPAEARFTAFPPNLARALRYVRKIRRGEKTEHASHNPLGALMVYAIWSCLGVIIASGVAMAGFPPQGVSRGEGHPAAYASAEYGEERERAGEAGESRENHEDGGMEELHQIAVNLLYVLIVLHIAGVVFETRRSGQQVVLAMLPRRR
ncbi:cytochrome b/b6 domain-containing protein [Novosphingobium sp. KA1]|uniref:cytochrome b/b6 domain-containing protein n=1 Tax=Novosphingobium sp. (strain KA1) TaxID=164608 RepID=UPI001A8EAB79|nr:cytochrome b/b6 domain-containing protein [Novosphingobium sp. KA1]QSR19404.1 cytochrome B [Novosphingobium sp. KA1]